MVIFMPVNAIARTQILSDVPHDCSWFVDVVLVLFFGVYWFDSHTHRPRVLQKLLYVLCECQFKMGQLNVNKYHNLNKCYTRIWVPINEGSTNMNRYHN